ncbi:hypothetical protein GE09DRAFT_361486 [Coniochaeta sp. 2T2.1]|nr:hypothetical protein GE09DRAFT_361486 [Coniochaeta sp. 2T2.1]
MSGPSDSSAPGHGRRNRPSSSPKYFNFQTEMPPPIPRIPTFDHFAQDDDDDFQLSFPRSRPSIDPTANQCRILGGPGNTPTPESLNPGTRKRYEPLTEAECAKIQEDPSHNIPDLFWERDPDDLCTPLELHGPCNRHRPCYCGFDLCGACCDTRPMPPTASRRHNYVPKPERFKVTPDMVAFKPWHRLSNQADMEKATDALLFVMSQFEDVLPLALSERLHTIREAVRMERQQGPNNWITAREDPSALTALARFVKEWSNHPHLARRVARHVGQNFHFSRAAHRLEAWLDTDRQGKRFTFDEEVLGNIVYVQDSKEWWAFIWENWPLYHWVVVTFLLQLAGYCQLAWEKKNKGGAGAETAEDGMEPFPQPMWRSWANWQIGGWGPMEKWEGEGAQRRRVRPSVEGCEGKYQGPPPA